MTHLSSEQLDRLESAALLGARIYPADMLAIVQELKEAQHEAASWKQASAEHQAREMEWMHKFVDLQERIASEQR